jgi:glycosyltransferase involved in cell wall biosynthesis
MNRVKVGVVIPARNEAALVSRSISSVFRAARHAAIRPLVVLVDDGSTDETSSVASRILRPPFGCILRIDAGNVGIARSTGVQCLADYAAGRIAWVATTDADTAVPPDWFSRQLQQMQAGADGVAGVVDLDCRARLSMRAAFADAYTNRLTNVSHQHVHGANLAFRLDRYLAIGGFRPLPCGEDRDLWRRLSDAGCKLVSDAGSVAHTSARLTNRVPGGFAADLRRLRGLSLALER